MRGKKAKEQRKEEQRIRESFGINPEAAKQKQIPILGCPACQECGEWSIILDDFPPYAEKSVAIVCKKCRYFSTFIVDLRMARGMEPLGGKEDVGRQNNDETLEERGNGNKEKECKEGRTYRDTELSRNKA